MTNTTSAASEAELCLALMRADTEIDVVKILKDAGYWDDPAAWRLFSDNENSFSVIGNQQAEAVAAFVEKIVNSVDARLVNISSRGFMAETKAIIEAGSRIWLTLPGPGRVNALVVWTRGGRIGGEFAQPIDPLTVFQAIGQANA